MRRSDAFAAFLLVLILLLIPFLDGCSEEGCAPCKICYTLADSLDAIAEKHGVPCEDWDGCMNGIECHYLLEDQENGNDSLVKAIQNRRMIQLSRAVNQKQK
ncbi:MAG: hypothetical protein AAFP92_30420 [Bacteroidota bacterium]